jgi:hypothetical protein
VDDVLGHFLFGGYTEGIQDHFEAFFLNDDTWEPLFASGDIFDMLLVLIVLKGLAIDPEV